MSNPSPPTLSADAVLASFTGHAAQAAFVASVARFSLYVGGVGAGKTTAAWVRPASSTNATLHQKMRARSGTK